ncbi:MAG: ferredoxin--NADP reductase [Candidatus Poribacteria bacterium]|nr:MAG: ferredoxin--NADP reductase [Candidatus Poribacteria bacterium]
MSETPTDVKDITIIGGGPVGLFGAFYAGVRECSTRIIDSLPELGGQLTALYPEKYIYDMPGFPKIRAKDLVARMVDQGLWKNPQVCLNEQAQELHFDEASGLYALKTSKGVRWSRTVILCAGIGSLQPTRLDRPGVEELVDKGVYYVVRNPEQWAGKRVVIVGGGDSAVDWALHLAPIAKKLTLVHRRDVFRAHEGNVRELMKQPIEILLWWVVEEAHGTDHLEAVTIRNTKTGELRTLEADALIIQIGFKSDPGPIRSWGLELHGGQVVVDRHMETNRKGVFAAGDIAWYDGKLKLIAVGVGEVAIAVNYAKVHIDPNSKVFPGHSSDMGLR